MRRLATFLSYPFGTQARLLAAAALLVSLAVGIVAAPFARVRSALLWLADRAAAVVPGDPKPGRVVAAVEVADGELPGERTCLVRSLTAETLLRLYGHAPEHRIGVDPDAEGGMKAHSWLEHGGEILIGDLEDLSRYEPLPPLDGGNAP